MSYSRNEFLKISVAAISGWALAPMLFKEEKKIKTFGLQLYTLRDVLLNDPKNILKQVASFGYKQIESYEGPNGMFWGMSNIEFKKTLDDLGMKIISSHCDIYKDFEKKAADAAAIGMKYLMSSSLTENKNQDEIKKLAGQFNKCGELCKKAGLRFAYHAEDHDFKNLDGTNAEEILLNNTDASLVDFQMDIYWFTSVGQDPENWLKKYKGRFTSSHIKDRTKGNMQRDASCDLGKGNIDIPGILKIAAAVGMKYFFVEQEQCENNTPMKSIEADANYMKRLKI
jgi:sugar phosphate isomerase/epimerase